MERKIRGEPSLCPEKARLSRAEGPPRQGQDRAKSVTSPGCVAQSVANVLLVLRETDRPWPMDQNADQSDSCILALRCLCRYSILYILVKSIYPCCTLYILRSISNAVRVMSATFTSCHLDILPTAFYNQAHPGSKGRVVPPR